MILRPWRWRELMAEAKEREVEAREQEATQTLARVKAQRPEVEQTNRALRRETIELNGWTQRAKKAFG